MALTNPLKKFGYVPISKEARFERMSEEVAAMRELDGKRPLLPPVKKNLVGRPGLVTAINEGLCYAGSDEDRPGPAKQPADIDMSVVIVDSRVRHRPTSYKNWFNKQDLPKILAALKLHGYKVRKTVDYLKQKFRNPGMRGQFQGLNESTIRGWLNQDGRTFKEKVQRAITAVLDGPDEMNANIMRPGVLRTWIGREELEFEFHQLMVSLRSADLGLNSLLIQFQMKAFIAVRCPEILVEGGGNFQVSRSYVRKWVVLNLGWSFRRPNSDSKSLPANWEALGDRLAAQIAYLVFLYHIPPELVVNGDQTGILLMPVGDERTYTYKGARKVLISGRGDKRQITLLMSISAAGDLLPLQVIFEGITKAVIPGGQDALLLKATGNHLTMTANHWSSLESMKNYVICIYLPWFRKVCQEKGLDAAVQKSILLLDCFSIHKSAAFRSWMKQGYPNICLLLVPAYTTSVLQPCDLVLQRPFKCAVQRLFQQYAVDTIKKQMEGGVSAATAKLDTGIAILRNCMCTWLRVAINQVYPRRDMLISGWRKPGLLRAWDKDFQLKAIEINKDPSTNLFDDDAMHEFVEEPLYTSQDVWLGDKTVAEVFNSCVEPNKVQSEDSDDGGLELETPVTASKATTPNFIAAAFRKAARFSKKKVDKGQCSGSKTTGGD